jgi:glyoxylase I family protein
MAISAKLPSRLHHTAYVTRDQEKTRRFYEDVIGLPLAATWCESDELFGKVRTYVHTFYGIGDGGALAFFQFADPKDQEEFGPKMPATPFHHIALNVDAVTQAGIEERIAKAGIKPPDTYVLEHGYCRSVYVLDPNGLTLEFTRDHPDVEKITRDRRADAHKELKRWLAGDHTSNNTYR